jgi:hypothetical protein
MWGEMPSSMDRVKLSCYMLYRPLASNMCSPTTIPSRPRPWWLVHCRTLAVHIRMWPRCCDGPPHKGIFVMSHFCAPRRMPPLRPLHPPQTRKGSDGVLPGPPLSVRHFSDSRAGNSPTVRGSSSFPNGAHCNSCYQPPPILPYHTCNQP